jgi:hypothetical protein
MIVGPGAAVGAGAAVGPGAAVGAGGAGGVGIESSERGAREMNRRRTKVHSKLQGSYLVLYRWLWEARKSPVHRWVGRQCNMEEEDYLDF